MEAKKQPLTLVKLKKQVNPYKGSLVIVDFEIKRLVGAVEYDDDFYFIFKNLSGKIEQHSACGCDWIPLDGEVDGEKYRNLFRLWKLNVKKNKI